GPAMRPPRAVARALGALRDLGLVEVDEAGVGAVVPPPRRALGESLRYRACQARLARCRDFLDRAATLDLGVEAERVAALAPARARDAPAPGRRPRPRRPARPRPRRGRRGRRRRRRPAPPPGPRGVASLPRLPGAPGALPRLPGPRGHPRPRRRGRARRRPRPSSGPRCARPGPSPAPSAPCETSASSRSTRPASAPSSRPPAGPSGSRFATAPARRAWRAAATSWTARPPSTSASRPSASPPSPQLGPAMRPPRAVARALGALRDLGLVEVDEAGVGAVVPPPRRALGESLRYRACQARLARCRDFLDRAATLDLGVEAERVAALA